MSWTQTGNPVPVATYTGWNLYKTPFPEGELCDRDGSYFAFAKTRAELEIVAAIKGYKRGWVDHVMAERGGGYGRRGWR